MARPRKWRRVCCLPDSSIFGPLDYAADKSNPVRMTVDEYETIRLIDLEGFTQEECSERMNVARTTVQGIYFEARRKLAISLVDGRVLTIEGGEYRLCDGVVGCGRGCRRQMGHRAGQGNVPPIKNIQEKVKQENINIGGNNMKIGIPVDDKNMDSTVCVSFGRAPYYLIYDVENKTGEFLENVAAASAGGAGIRAAQFLVDQKVAAVLTPRCGENAASVLQAAGIKLYKTDSVSIKGSIDSFVKESLAELREIHAGLHYGR